MQLEDRFNLDRNVERHHGHAHRRTRVPAGIAENELAADLSVGSLAGGGDLGDVDLVYIPEPSAKDPLDLRAAWTSIHATSHLTIDFSYLPVTNLNTRPR